MPELPIAMNLQRVPYIGDGIEIDVAHRPKAPPLWMDGVEIQIVGIASTVKIFIPAEAVPAIAEAMVEAAKKASKRDG